MANFLLIKDVNSELIVDNIIVAEQQEAQAYLEEPHNYDFVLDQSQYNPTPGIGWIYDDGQNTFEAPAIDYIPIVRNGLNELQALLLTILSDSANLDSTDLLEAINQGTSDVEGSFTENEEAVFTSITNWLQTEDS